MFFSEDRALLGLPDPEDRPRSRSRPDPIQELVDGILRFRGRDAARGQAPAPRPPREDAATLARAAEDMARRAGVDATAAVARRPEPRTVSEHIRATTPPEVPLGVAEPPPRMDPAVLLRLTTQPDALTTPTEDRMPAPLRAVRRGFYSLPPGKQKEVLTAMELSRLHPAVFAGSAAARLAGTALRGEKPGAMDVADAALAVPVVAVPARVARAGARAARSAAPAAFPGVAAEGVAGAERASEVAARAARELVDEATAPANLREHVLWRSAPASPGAPGAERATLRVRTADQPGNVLRVDDIRIDATRAIGRRGLERARRGEPPSDAVDSAVQLLLDRAAREGYARLTWPAGQQLYDAMLPERVRETLRKLGFKDDLVRPPARPGDAWEVRLTDTLRQRLLAAGGVGLTGAALASALAREDDETGVAGGTALAALGVLGVPGATVTGYARLLEQRGLTDIARRLREHMRGSVVKRIMYHGTRAPQGFGIARTTPTNPLNYGFHVGSLDQATARVGHRIIESGGELIPTPVPVSFREHASIMPLAVNIKRPLVLKDYGHWVGLAAINSLKKKLTLSQDEIRGMEHLLRVRETTPDRREAERAGLRLARRIMDTIERHGYDGVAYRNNFEGPGWSFIVFRPQQVKSLLSARVYSRRLPELSAGIGGAAIGLDAARKTDLTEEDEALLAGRRP